MRSVLQQWSWRAGFKRHLGFLARQWLVSRAIACCGAPSACSLLGAGNVLPDHADSNLQAGHRNMNSQATSSVRIDPSQPKLARMALPAKLRAARVLQAHLLAWRMLTTDWSASEEARTGSRRRFAHRAHAHRVLQAWRHLTHVQVDAVRHMMATRSSNARRAALLSWRRAFETIRKGMARIMSVQRKSGWRLVRCIMSRWSSHVLRKRDMGHKTRLCQHSLQKADRRIVSDHVQAWRQAVSASRLGANGRRGLRRLLRAWVRQHSMARLVRAVTARCNANLMHRAVQSLSCNRKMAALLRAMEGRLVARTRVADQGRTMHAWKRWVRRRMRIKRGVMLTVCRRDQDLSLMALRMWHEASLRARKLHLRIVLAYARHGRHLVGACFERWAAYARVNMVMAVVGSRVQSNTRRSLLRFAVATLQEYALRYRILKTRYVAVAQASRERVRPLPSVSTRRMLVARGVAMCTQRVYAFCVCLSVCVYVCE